MRATIPRRAVPMLGLVVATTAMVTVPPAAQADDKRECTNDGSLSFEFCVGMTYEETRDGDRRFVKVSRMRAEVRVKDRQVKIRRVTLGGNVLGRCLTTCGELGAIDLSRRLAAGPGRRPRTVLQGRPPWHRWYTQVGGVSHVCALVVVDWSRGTKRYQSLHDRCIGAPFDTLSIADREDLASKIGALRH
jgi:hypothetical protein